MPGSAIAAELRTSQPIEFEYRDGLFHLNDPSLGFLRSMPPAQFFASIVNAVECARKHRPWEKPTAEIICFASHQAAASGRPSK